MTIIITRVRKFDEAGSTRQKYSFFSIYELQSYEVLKIQTNLNDSRIRTLQTRSVMNIFNKNINW